MTDAPARLTGLHPATADRLSEQVAAQIADAILSGALQPGEHLVEAEIAASLRISKSPVREALRDLAGRGLITLQPRRGAFVRGLTLKDLREITVLRAALEALAINLGIARHDEGWLKDLQRDIQGMLQASGKAEINRRHIAFHRTLASRCDNTRVLEAIDAISTQTQIFMAMVGQLYRTAEAVAADHTGLLEAIAVGDPEQVRHVVDNHILATERDLEALWLGSVHARDDHPA